MFTRFRAATAVHVFDTPPLLKIPPHVAGGSFLATLGGAYESEAELYRQWLIRNARDSKISLEQSDLMSQAGVAKFVDELKMLLEFLESIEEDSVAVYSYDRVPSIDDLLDAFQEGFGANDWALEELGKKGEKGRKSLLSRLKKEKDKGRLLAAVSMLLIVFRDDGTIGAIRKWIDAGPPEIGKEAALLLAAYTST